MNSDQVRAELRDNLQRLAVEYEVPGVAAAVAVGDDVVQACFGVVNTRTGVPVTPDTLFMIQSITKTITATLIMQLVDDELLALDDAVHDHLPAFRTSDQELSDRITVRHLLTHTAGFDGDLWATTTSESDALERFVEDVVPQAAQHSAPGERYSYCSAGFGVLGRLIEVKRASTFEEALRHHIAEPLGIDELAFTADEALAFRTAIGHVPQDPGLQPLFNWATMPASNPAAGNQLAMSARGLLSYARMHLSDGLAPDGSRVLSRASARLMRTHQVEHGVASAPSSHHGLGWTLDGAELVGHGGGSVGVAAMLRTAPRHGRAAVVLTNAESGAALINELLAPLFADVSGWTEDEGSAALPGSEVKVADVRPYLGCYESRVSRITIIDDDGRLQMTIEPQHESLELAARAGVTFESEHAELRPDGAEGFVMITEEEPVGRVEFVSRRTDGRYGFVVCRDRAIPRRSPTPR